MSFKIVELVHASRIEPWLRHLAQTLAIFANDEGGEIRPGMKRLTQALGVGESTVREQEQALVERQLLMRDGFYHHTRRFKWDLPRLVSYVPLESRAAWRRSRPRQKPYAGAKGSTSAEPYAGAKGSDAEPDAVANGTLRPGVANPTPGRCQPFARAYPDLHDRQEGIRRSGDQEIRKSTRARRADHPVENSETAHVKSRVPADSEQDIRAIYDDLARLALADANAKRHKRTRQITEHFKRRCAERGVSHNHALALDAVTKAIAGRDRAQKSFWLGASLPTPLRTALVRAKAQPPTRRRRHA